jgi:hypothetical protein
MSDVVVFTSRRWIGSCRRRAGPDEDPVLGSRHRLVADGGPVAATYQPT